MSDWISQYSAALDERDAREKAHSQYIDAYTKLADRTAALEQTSSAPQADEATASATDSINVGKAKSTSAAAAVAAATAQQSKSPIKSPPTINKLPSTTTTERSNNTPTQTPHLLAQLRADLASTQRTRSDLTNQLTTCKLALQNLTTTQKTTTRQVDVLAREKRDLERALRDRDEEVRQKQRLVEHVHDEMAGLNLELNMLAQRAEDLKRENDMLVRRWMDKMGEEAERMNLESQWR